MGIEFGLLRIDNESFLQLDLLLDQDDVNNARLKEAIRGIIFVLVCSGSMGGDSIQQVKRALDAFLRGFPQRVGFNICRFGSRCEFLLKQPEQYSETSLNKALGYLYRADADLGGTEIFDALKAICSKSHDGKQDIILLTDGQVENEQENFEFIREHHTNTRVFPVGIGAGCNELFIKGLARAGNGASEFSYPGERIEPRVLSLFGKVGQAGLENAFIAWGPGEANQAPLSTAIFFETAVTVFARTTAENFEGKEIEVRGKVNGSERTWKIPVLDVPDNNLPIPTLWARERVRSLEEPGALTEGSGSRQIERTKEWKEKTILEICKRYVFLSQSASYVTVEKREERNRTTGELELCKIPIPVTARWHGMGGLRDVRVYHPVVPESTQPERFSGLISGLGFSSLRAMCGPSLPPGERDRVADFQTVKYSILPRGHAITDSGTATVIAILSLQKARGRMNLDARICEMLGIDLEQLKRDARQIKTTTKADKFGLLSTALLLTVLEVWFPGEFSTWSGVTRKSRRWLDDNILKSSPELCGRKLMPWVDEFVRARVSPRMGA